MADELRFGEFQFSAAGVREVTRSAAVLEEVASLAKSKAAEANRAALSRRDTEDESQWRRKDPYEGTSKLLRNTAIGMVSTTGVEGILDQSAHHTLDSVNH